MSIRLEVLQYFDQSGRMLVYRIPQSGSASIKIGSQLIVHQGQEAIFVRDGKPLDAFGPGRFTLTTQNVPLITDLLTIPWEKNPFQAQVYFIGKQLFTEQKWGTRQPILVKDPDFGMVQIRSYGSFSFRIKDSALVLTHLVGTQGMYAASDAQGYIKDRLLSSMKDLIATTKVPMLELASKQDEIAAGTKAKVAEDLARVGLEIVDLFIESFSLPPKVQEKIDEIAGMNAIPDMGRYTMYKTAESLEKMAENQGAAGGGMGMGMGAGFGMMLPQMMQQAMAGQAPYGGQTPPPSAPPTAPTQTPPTSPPAPGSAAPAGQTPPTSPPSAPAVAGAAGAAATPTNDLGLDGLTPVNAPQANAPQMEQAIAPAELIKTVATSADWKVSQADDHSLILTVPVGPTRRQRVYVRFDQTDAEDHSMISYKSYCGPATEKNAYVLLKYNTKMVHGAFAVESTESGDQIVMQANQLKQTLDAVSILRTVTTIAWQADKVEEKLIEGDEE